MPTIAERRFSSLLVVSLASLASLTSCVLDEDGEADLPAAPFSPVPPPPPVVTVPCESDDARAAGDVDVPAVCEERTIATDLRPIGPRMTIAGGYVYWHTRPAQDWGV